jgi:hypothetical protein
MVFPVQIRGGVPGDASPEIEFALRTRTTEVGWVFSDELESTIARSPSVDTSVRGLPVGVFLGTEVQRIGDPLFGQLLRLGAMTGADVALIPVAVRPGVGGAGGVGGISVVEIVVTLLNVRTGRVMWFGVVAGRPGSLADFGTVASAVEELAETLLWYL